jgi:hypothetical protein
MVALCEVGEMLAERLGLPRSVRGLFVYTTDRWDGKGPLRRAKGEEIPSAMMIANVARDSTLQHLLRGVERAAEVVGARGGGSFDPLVAGRRLHRADRGLSELSRPPPSGKGGAGRAEGERCLRRAAAARAPGERIGKWGERRRPGRGATFPAWVPQLTPARWRF